MHEIKFRAWGNDKKWYYFSLGDLVTGSTQSTEFTDVEFEHRDEYTGSKIKTARRYTRGILYRKLVNLLRNSAWDFTTMIFSLSVR